MLNKEWIKISFPRDKSKFNKEERLDEASNKAIQEYLTNLSVNPLIIAFGKSQGHLNEGQ